jgi:hypothetical protein
LAEVISRFVIRVINGLPPLVFGDGEQGHDFTYVTDIARGLILAEFIDTYIYSCLAEIVFAGHFLDQKYEDVDEQGKPASRWPDDEGTGNGGVSGFSHIGH